MTAPSRAPPIGVRASSRAISHERVRQMTRMAPKPMRYGNGDPLVSASSCSAVLPMPASHGPENTLYQIAPMIQNTTAAGSAARWGRASMVPPNWCLRTHGPAAPVCIGARGHASVDAFRGVDRRVRIVVCAPNRVPLGVRIHGRGGRLQPEAFAVLRLHVQDGGARKSPD